MDTCGREKFTDPKLVIWMKLEFWRGLVHIHLQAPRVGMLWRDPFNLHLTFSLGFFEVPVIQGPVNLP